MPTPNRGPRLGGSPAHERLMLANLATALFEHGAITTTHTKAKRLRPYAEHLITFGKRGDLHARRMVGKVIRDKTVLHRLFAEIGPQFAARPGGYTRITKIGPRKGDNAPMARIELVEAQTVAQVAVGEAERARGTRFARRGAPTPATAEAARDLAAESPTAAAVAAGTAAEADPRTGAGAEVPAEAAGEGAGADSAAAEQVAVPTEGGDETVVTEAGVTEAPATEAVATEAPATEAVATEAPATTDTAATDSGATDAQGEGSAESGAPEGAGQTESAGDTSQAEGEADADKA